MADMDDLRLEYLDARSKADRLAVAVVSELYELFRRDEVSLGVPIESRVKDWESIVEKSERKSIELSSILELSDFIGLRVILLFKKDLGLVHDIVTKSFQLISSEDTAERLSDSEFGYQSHHYVIKVPADWLSVPTWAGLGGFTIELQVRTLAQHIWAAASHKLQYKQESGVPLPIRRSINRVSALLETVDLELQRVLEERLAYKEFTSASLSVDDSADDSLNVDNLVVLLGEIFPSANKAESEDYAELLSDMFLLGVKSRSQAQGIFKKRYDDVMKKEKEFVKRGPNAPSMPDSRGAGVYFKHVGLARSALIDEFGREALVKARQDRKNLTMISD